MKQIYVLVLLLIIVILCVTLYSFVKIEHYLDSNITVSAPVSNDKLPLNIIKLTGRDISFPYYGENSMFTASQRALLDTSISTNPNGKCYQMLPSTGVLDSSYSIVMENNIYYILKKSCMNLKIEKISIANNGSIIIRFTKKKGVDVENLTKFLLVNPLFVEFTSENFVSVAYILHSSNVEANTSTITIDNISTKPLELQFDVTTPLRPDCDSAFDYASYSPKQKQVTKEDIQSGRIGSNKSVNMWVYYLDNMNISFQKIGLDFPTPVQLDKTQLVLFRKDYESLSNDPKQVKLYEFMKNIAIKYKIGDVPVLNYSFNILVNKPTATNPTTGGISLTSTKYGKGKYFQLLRVFMNNGYYAGNGPCNNNMLITTLVLYDNVFSILVGVGDKDNDDDIGDCGFVNDKSPPALLTLPYASDNTTFNVTVTIGPKQKYIYVQWFDLNSGKKCAFTNTTKYLTSLPLNSCGDYEDNSISEANVMTRMFASKDSKFIKKPLEDIFLVADTDFVTDINAIYFGYPNFNNLYAAI